VNSYLASFVIASSFLFFKSDSADTWERIADAGSWAVIVGVVLELPELAVKLFEGSLKKWPKLEHQFKNYLIKSNLTQRFESLKRYEYWIDALALFAWLIIVVGLVVEVGANQRARVIQDTDFLKLSSEAAETHERAAKIELAAAELQKQIQETTNKVAKIDPRNQIIFDMTAWVVFAVKGRDFNDVTNWDSQRVARMYLDYNQTTHWQFDVLDANSVIHNPIQIWNGSYRTYGVHFSSLRNLTVMGYETPAKALDDVKFLRMELNFLPHDSEITGGNVQLVVNNIQKTFAIPPQAETNKWGGTWGNPYTVIATNSDKTPHK
jgi:hypothetical protein